MSILPYKNLFVGIIQAINNVFFNEEYAGKEVEKTLKSNRKWGSRDRFFVAETIYDLVRWKRLVESFLGEDLSQNNLWEFVGTWFLLKNETLPKWEEFKKLSEIEESKFSISKNPAVKYSVPDWLYELGKKELGESRWHKELEALNVPAATVLRVNTLKTNREKLQKLLESEKIKTKILPEYPSALELEEKINIRNTKFFKDGLFEIQDSSSQLIAPFLNPKSGTNIVDACAGAGGKSLHLATIMQNKGQIIALDLYDWKLKELQKRAERNGIKNIQTKLADSKTIKELYNFADKLLIDAPCSGLGVLKRNPDAKWKLNAEFLKNVQKEQIKILNNYSKILKIGGEMLYATCSILPSENRNQIDVFLSENQNFRLIKDKTIFPSESGYDGFYMALLERYN